MCLGLLASCGPTESKVPAPEVSRASKSSALTTISVPVLKWVGSTGACLGDCGTGPDYACSNSSGWNNGEKFFMDPLPNGGVVVGVEARVYGRLTNGVSVLDIPVELNGFRLGSYTSLKEGCGGTCEPPKQVFFSDSNGVPGYAYGGTNRLKLQVPSGSSVYCVSHAELLLTVAEPRIAVSPFELSFGNQKPGTISAPKVVTVRNVGEAPLHVTAGSTIGPFSLQSSSSVPFTLQPGEVMSLPVSFFPNAVGAATGTLNLISNDSTRPSVTVALSGTGVASAVDVSPTSHDFGEQLVGTTSPARTVTVLNRGSAPLQVHAVSISAPFTVTSSGPFTLAPGESLGSPGGVRPLCRGGSHGHPDPLHR